jgi:regulatory protein
VAGSGSAAPVAAAAEWLSRHGVAVPGAVGSADAPEARGSAEPDHSPHGRRDPRSAQTDRAQQGESAAVAGEPAAGSDGDAEADPYAVAKSIALDRIATRDRTRHELAQALKAKNVPPEITEQVLDRLQEVGLVDDAAFAEAWVESRQQRRHLSRPALRRELQAKGVDRDKIDVALESVDYGDELGAARELARRRHRAIAELPYPVRYRRLAGALSRRGFGPGIVTQVLREVLGEE